MADLLRPLLELASVFPGLLLAYIPVKSYLKQPPRRLMRWLLPLMLTLCAGGALICARLRVSSLYAMAVVSLAAIAVYALTLRISLWKSITIALAVCAVFACLSSIVRALDAAASIRRQCAGPELWLRLRAAAGYHAACWLTVAAACYPAGRVVKDMVEDENFAQTWYAFWVLPIIFIALNLFMIPRHQETLHTGRVLEGYILLSVVLLVLFLWFNVIFLMMANSLNRNARLQLENHFLSLQRERYEGLKTAIEDARQARHDMRHHFSQISMLAERGDVEQIREYLVRAAGRIPSLDMSFCENRAADSVVGYYCALARREGVPFRAQVDLPAEIPLDEIDLCLVLSNLLENALEASLKTDPARRGIHVRAYIHSNRLLLIQVENAFDGEIHEKNGVFLSTKHTGNGVGTQSVRRIAERAEGACAFTHQGGVFSARVMLPLAKPKRQRA